MDDYRLILFDFDGTLANSLEKGLQHYNVLAEQYGFLPITDITAARQMKTKHFFRAHKIPLRRLPRLYKEFTGLQRSYMPEVPLFEGMAEVLRSLARRYRLGILSSNSAENIRACLHANGVLDLFETVSSHSSIFGKQKSLRKILKSSQVPRERAVYVGDEVRDMKAATRARIDGCAVTWGMHSESFLSSEGPRYVARRPADLLAVFSVPGVANDRPTRRLVHSDY